MKQSLVRVSQFARSRRLAALCSLVLALSTGWSSAQAAELDETGTLWGPVIEWSLNNSSWSGNPFDLEAYATFVHTESGETRKTPLYYDGGETWKFRFTATRTGTWTVRTESSDSDLNGKTGTIEIAPNPDPEARGFIVAKNGKFAKQVGENGELEAFVPNIYMNLQKFGNPEKCGWTHMSPTFSDPRVFNEYLDEIEEHGSNAAFALVANQWFHIGEPSSRGHGSENPDFETFAALEQAIQMAHSRGMHIHIWAWGDESRDWTPTRVGGVNGKPDRRIQRYIAARLGPLPGWTMGYGFDLKEWANESQVASWEDYINSHSGWEHLLMARKDGRFSDVESLPAGGYDDRPTRNFYDAAVDLLEYVPDRPAQFERRFGYLRDDVWTMENTRRAFWQFTLAGGTGSVWGYYPPDCSAYKKGSYPDPHQLRTHREFWRHRFLIDMKRANNLSNDSDTRVLRDGNRAVFYRENANAIHLNLSSMDGSQPAIAVDALGHYEEIDLGLLDSDQQTWRAPYRSDWAIAVGSFAFEIADPTEPETPEELGAAVVAPDRIDLRWQAPWHGGSSITGYRIQRQTEGETGFVDIEPNTGSSATFYSDHSVETGTTYTYRVSAINQIGESEFSNEATATAGEIDVSGPNLKDFGAVGDGATDDTRALRDAIAEFGKSGLPLIVPSGRYLITEDVSIDAPIQFIGEDNKKSVFTSNGRSARLYIRESGTGFSDIGFENMIEPIALESRSGYVLENVTIERSRFEDIDVQNRNRGVIGLPSGSSSDRPHPIRNLIVRDSVFLNINASAINIRGNVSHAQITGNEFDEIHNDPANTDSQDTFAIRLGDPSEGHAAGQGHHLIANNRIRNLRKATASGNLIALLLYGDSSVIENNTIEKIDGTENGLDTHAIYVRGSFNEIIGNTIREIRGTGENGAIQILGEMTQGNQQNIVSENNVEQISGLFAILAESADFELSGNQIRNAPIGALLHRGGPNLTVTGNTFSEANVFVRTTAGDATFSGNDFFESAIILSQADSGSSREQVAIVGNLFRRTKTESPVPMIRMEAGVAEKTVTVRNNRFEDLTGIAATEALIDLGSNGSATSVEITGNAVVLPDESASFFVTNADNENVSDNQITYGSEPAPNPPADSDTNLALEVGENGPSLVWIGKPGFVYQIQISSDLKTWTDHGAPIAGDRTQIHVNDLPGEDVESMFYRLKILETGS